jgi:hypothetical protein
MSDEAIRASLILGYLARSVDDFLGGNVFAEAGRWLSHERHEELRMTDVEDMKAMARERGVPEEDLVPPPEILELLEDLDGLRAYADSLIAAAQGKN